MSGARHARDEILGGFWVAGSPPLLQVPVSGTSYVKHRYCMGRPETGAASFTFENRLAYTVASPLTTVRTATPLCPAPACLPFDYV
jgi:hypothetical protein